MAEPNITRDAILKLLGAVMEERHGPSRADFLEYLTPPGPYAEYARERLPQMTNEGSAALRNVNLDYLTPGFDPRKERIEPMPREQPGDMPPRRRRRELGR